MAPTASTPPPIRNAPPIRANHTSLPLQFDFIVVATEIMTDSR
jgi:hypothetical protein